MEAMFESSTSDAPNSNNAAAQGASPTAAAQAAVNAASGSGSSKAAGGTAPTSTGQSVLDKAMAAIRQAGMGGSAPAGDVAVGAAGAPTVGPSPVAAAETRLQELMKKQATMNSVTEHLQAGDETAALGCLIKITGVPQPLGPGKIASQEIARCVDLACTLDARGWSYLMNSLMHGGLSVGVFCLACDCDGEYDRMKAQNYAMIINAQQNLKTAQAAQQAADEAAKSDTAVNDFKFVINDYPQQVRWKLTHRDTITEINDFTGAYRDKVSFGLNIIVEFSLGLTFFVINC